MKPKFLITLAAALALLGTVAVGQSASSSGEKVAYVNVQQVLSQVQEGKKALADLAAQFKPKQVELRGEQTAIQQMQQQLQNGGDTLSADAKAELQQNLQTKEQEYQRDAQDAQSDFQTAQSNAANRIFGRLVPIIQAYAKAHGYALVLDANPPQAPVLFASQAIDITNAVVRAYDQAHPAPAAEAAAAPSAPAASAK